ncbi:MAG: hypothetical protein JOY54_13730 [Acidobacteriaceae bacterium]|nr:hypothetical protein [Acidobacteriaceae bacterium]
MKAIRLLLAGLLASALIWAADVTGKWTAELPARGGSTMTMTLNLKTDGNNLTGMIGGQRGEIQITDGKVDGDNISFSVVREFNGNQFKQNYKGKVEGDTIHFTVTMEGTNGNGRSRQFDAKRAS